MKRFLSFLLAGGLLLPAFSVQANFPDTRGTPASPAVTYLQENDVVQGYQDGTFGPGREITRAEFLKIALKSADLLEENCSGPDETFSDVQKSDWFYDVVCSAVKNEIVNGYPDGTFRPNANVNFAEAAKIVSRTEELAPLETADQEWFSGFVATLKEQRVLSDTVDAPSDPLTREEMAQLIWGLQTGYEVENTDLGALPKLETCSELSAQLVKYQKRQGFFSAERGSTGILTPNDRGDGAEEGGDGDGDGDAADEEAGSPAPLSPNANSSKEADDFSTTNVQEFGVDEADIVKNNGSHIYMIKNNTIRIIAAYPPEDMAEVAVLTVDDKGFYPREMYLDGDVLTVIGNGGYYPYDGISIRDEEDTVGEKISVPYGGQALQVISYDVSDPADPEEIRTVTFDGNYVNSRKIGDVVYLVANKYPNWYWGRPIPLITEDTLPRFSDSAGSEATLIAPCSDIRYFPNFRDANFLILAAIDTTDTSVEIDRELLLGSGQEIYASPENLYVTRPEYREWHVQGDDFIGWRAAELTEIYKFALDGATVEFAAKGEAEGRVINQFAMSEAGDHFRMATQKGWAWGNDRSSSSVFIFDEDLNETGRIEDIAPGEDLKSARFIGDRGYLITFRNVDPLFVVDLDPENPEILGKLKIPGWSDYLHPYDEDHLIGFGREVKAGAESKERITSEDLLGMKLSFFDVSDVENPVEMHKEVIGARGTNSELLNNHKALLFDKNKGILGFPVTVTEEKNNGSVETVFSGAQVYDLDLENGFTLRGEMTNYEDDSWFERSGEWFYGDWEHNIQRLLYIGEYFYSVAPNYIGAYTWNDLNEIEKIQLEQKECQEIWNASECSAAPQCRTIWQTTSECYEDDGEEICTEDRQFLRCEER